MLSFRDGRIDGQTKQSLGITFERATQKLINARLIYHTLKYSISTSSIDDYLLPVVSQGASHEKMCI
jgi:hypothetical protein